jgi:hypothetical protein
VRPCTARHFRRHLGHQPPAQRQRGDLGFSGAGRGWDGALGSRWDNRAAPAVRLRLGGCRLPQEEARTGVDPGPLLCARPASPGSRAGAGSGSPRCRVFRAPQRCPAVPPRPAEVPRRTPEGPRLLVQAAAGPGLPLHSALVALKRGGDRCGEQKPRV